MFNLVKVVFYITEIQSASGLVISHKIINFSSYPLTLLLVFFTQLFYLFIKERQILWKEIQWWHHQSFSLAGKWKNCLTEWLIIIDLTSAPLYIIIIFFCKAVPFFTYGKQPDGSYTFGGIVYDLLKDAQNYLDIKLIYFLSQSSRWNQWLYFILKVWVYYHRRSFDKKIRKNGYSTQISRWKGTHCELYINNWRISIRS